MVKKTKGRTKRLGLISDKEKELIEITEGKKELMKEKEQLELKKSKTNQDEKRIKEISKKLKFSSKRFSTFERDLEQRLDYARDDLQLILSSSSLQRFRARYRRFFKKPFKDTDYDNWPLTAWFEALKKPDFIKYDGVEAIPDYSQWRIYDTGVGKARKFWLSTNENPKPTVRDSTYPEFSIIGIKGTWKRQTDTKERSSETINIREILLKALDLEKKWQGIIVSKKLSKIIPREKDEAIDILNIRRITKEFKKKLKTLE